VEIFVSNRVKVPAVEMRSFQEFLQRMANRRTVGSVRYGRVNAEQKYFSRLKKEAEAYRRSGNAEHLLNIAVYAFLETFAPENKRFHFDNTVDSVTRAGFGGEVARP